MTGRSGLAGVQTVPVPEPATLASIASPRLDQGWMTRLKVPSPMPSSGSGKLEPPACEVHATRS